MPLLLLDNVVKMHYPESCEKCRQMREKQEECKERREHKRALFRSFYRKLKDAGLAPKEVKHRFINFKADTDELKKAKRAAFEYAKDPRGVILFTSTKGSGKTHLASAIARTLIARGKRTKFIKTVELMMDIRSTFNGFSGRTAKDILGDLMSYDCLILDDLGIEKQSEFTFEVLYTLIDGFYRFEKSLIVTSNYSLEALDRRIGEIITSRLSEICKIVEYEAEDWRVVK